MSIPRSDGDLQTIKKPSSRPANRVRRDGTTTWQVMEGPPRDEPGRLRRLVREAEGLEEDFLDGEALDVPATVLNVSSKMISILVCLFVIGFCLQGSSSYKIGKKIYFFGFVEEVAWCCCC